ncbi:MAG: hypothetical protein IPN29_10005 [Saprospiraceae bacterium]|nr:hypothetical protein [Saprospiraceae bacterium]
MKLPIGILVLGIIFFSSCFIGADTYEHSVNDFFWLYSDTYSTDKVCLGTVEMGEFRIGSGYCCYIRKIGWDKSFIIIQNDNNEYYIQDCRKLKDQDVKVFRKFLHGPFNENQFEYCKDSLHIDKDLEFKIEY